MLYAWILVAALLVAVVIGFMLRQRSHDDVHSVEGYHRQIHTLEEMRTHPPGAGRESAGEGAAAPAYPESAFRVATSPTVRLTEPGQPIVPPVAPPPVPDPDKPVTFDDAGPVLSTPALSGSSGPSRHQDREMESINRRPRRLAAPAAAVAVVVVVGVVLLVTGKHHVTPPHHPPASNHATHTTRRTIPHQATTTTTLAAVVSAPTTASATEATYTVGPPSYTLVLAATTSECWVDATNATTGAVLYTGVLMAGQNQTLHASGPVSVVAGAPNAFAATINGTAVALPAGFQAPFTLQFVASPAG